MDNLTGGYAGAKKRPNPWVIAAVVLLHVVIFYGLLRALAPGAFQTAERSMVAAFSVTVTAPKETPPPPPEPEPEPDEGAQGDPGRDAVPAPVAAPIPVVRVREDPPMPRATSTGTAPNSGATEQGDGTGAAGSGLGTGSGRGGGGQGGIAATRPVHISGQIDNARDFPVPAGGRRARRGNEVIVKVTVGTDGRARNCSVYQASPDAEADRITCALVVERLRFKPATDRSGNPVEAPFYWKQRWF